jgi:hypothetical protein
MAVDHLGNFVAAVLIASILRDIFNSLATACGSPTVISAPKDYVAGVIFLADAASNAIQAIP